MQSELSMGCLLFSGGLFFLGSIPDVDLIPCELCISISVSNTGVREMYYCALVTFSSFSSKVAKL